MRLTAFDLASKYVYPSIRKRLVEILYNDFELSQNKVASLLHVTQSAVSRYLNSDRGNLIDISIFRDIDQKVKDFAVKIIKEQPDEYKIHFKLVSIALEMLGKGYVCFFHEKVDPSIDVKKCRLCITLFQDKD